MYIEIPDKDIGLSLQLPPKVCTPWEKKMGILKNMGETIFQKETLIENINKK